MLSVSFIYYQKNNIVTHHLNYVFSNFVFYILEKFEEFILSYEGFCKNPTAVFTDPKLVIQINERFLIFLIFFVTTNTKQYNKRFLNFIFLYQNQFKRIFIKRLLFIFSYYNWAVAGPYLMSFMAFDKPLQPVR